MANPNTSRLSLKQRVLEKIKSSANLKCWEWTGGKDADGYGVFSFQGYTKRAHRASYEAHHGPIPSDMVVCHRCDNASCVNPNHLFLGSHADNMADRGAKGRQARGETQGCAKLTEAQVIEIRSRRSEPQRELAKIFGVSQGQIYNVRSGKHWGHVQ
jgi:hypothetical protein